MKAVTLRNIPPELVRVIERRSRQTGKSLNRSKRKERRLYHDLDWMAGSWTREEANEFDRALAEQRTIDPERTESFNAPMLGSWPL